MPPPCRSVQLRPPVPLLPIRGSPESVPCGASLDPGVVHEELPVHLEEVSRLLRGLVLGEDRLHRADRLAGPQSMHWADLDAGLVLASMHGSTITYAMVIPLRSALFSGVGDSGPRARPIQLLVISWSFHPSRPLPSATIPSTGRLSTTPSGVARCSRLRDHFRPRMRASAFALGMP